MTTERRGFDIVLASATPLEWSAAATADVLSLLDDHAHLERKAASNALDLLARAPAGRVGEWSLRLAAVAADESRHLHQVWRHLRRRGGTPTLFHKNPYAKALHDRVRRGQARLELVDRLMVAAFIEARSCERFALLARALPGRDDGLARFYSSLVRSEEGHARGFGQLAFWVLDSTAELEGALSRWASIESEAMAAQTPGSRVHSGWPGVSGDTVEEASRRR